MTTKDVFAKVTELMSPRDAKDEWEQLGRLIGIILQRMSEIEKVIDVRGEGERRHSGTS
jgi:hypothetical protein